MDDFNLLAEKINKLYSNILCLPKVGKCYLNHSCDYYQNKNLFLNIMLKDSDNKSV